MSHSAPQAAGSLERLDGSVVSSAPGSGEIGWPALAGLGALVAMVAALYWSVAIELARVWEIDPNYSHGYFIPVFSLFFAYGAWQKVGWPIRAGVPWSSSLLGLAEVAFGLALHMVAWFFNYLLFDVLALICILRGSILALGGREVNQAYGFSILFLIFMAPLPMAWYQPLALFMQQLVSIISASLLEIFGVPVFRQGYIIQLPGYVMEVGAACSGLRQLTAFVALGVIVAHLFGHATWYKWTVSLLGVPLAIATNCLRVVLTGFIMMLAGKEWAEGVFHTIEGLVTLAIGTVLLVGTALFLSNWDPPPTAQKPKAEDPANSEPGSESGKAHADGQGAEPGDAPGGNSDEAAT